MSDSEDTIRIFAEKLYEKTSPDVCVWDHKDMWQKKDSKNKEAVNHPSHYNHGKYEVIDIIKDTLTDEQFYGFCIGNCLKYILRAPYKHETPTEDLKKCVWYLNKIIENLESEANG